MKLIMRNEANRHRVTIHGPADGSRHLLSVLSVMWRVRSLLEGPSSKIVRQSIRSAVETLLDEVEDVHWRAIVCDEANNPPDTHDLTTKLSVAWKYGSDQYIMTFWAES